jgi:hypothetical protein
MTVLFFGVMFRVVTGTDHIEVLCVGFEGHDGFPPCMLKL